MPAPRNRRHILVPTPPSREDYRPHPRSIDLPTPPAPEDRGRHADVLKRSLVEAQRQGQERREAAEITVHGAQPGLYVVFDSQPGVELKLQSLEDKRQGIELVGVTRHQAADGAAIERATVFVPEGKVKHFISRF